MLMVSCSLHLRFMPSGLSDCARWEMPLHGLKVSLLATLAFMVVLAVAMYCGKRKPSKWVLEQQELELQRAQEKAEYERVLREKEATVASADTPAGRAGGGR